MDVCKLYPQYNLVKDRRQPQNTNLPVAFERRSGVDRRAIDRVTLDTGLTKDIFEIRSKISQISPQKAEQQAKMQSNQQTAPQKIQKTTFNQNISKAAQNSIKTDQFIKSTNINKVESPKEIEKSKSDMGLAAPLAIMLGGTIAATFLGVAGVGIAVGLGAYFGGKLLKGAIVSHITDKKIK